METERTSASDERTIFLLIKSGKEPTDRTGGNVPRLYKKGPELILNIDTSSTAAGSTADYSFTLTEEPPLYSWT